MQGSADPDVHVVVFDVNVWLDVAALVGSGFTFDRLTERVAAAGMQPCPAQDRRLDSARALAVCTSGRLAGDELLEVWTSAHIDDVLVHKLTQGTDGVIPEETGYGWSADDAHDFLDDCVYELVESTYGGTVGEIVIPNGNPPLSHEDGCVYRTATEAGDDFPVRYCVTWDRDFRTAAGLPGDVTMFYPSEWVMYVRKARARLALAQIPRPPL